MLTAAIFHAESSRKDFSLESLHCVNNGEGGGGGGMVESYSRSGVDGARGVERGEAFQ